MHHVWKSRSSGYWETIFSKNMTLLQWGVTFHRNVARYSLKFSRCSLLVVKSLVTRRKTRSLLFAEVAHCKKSLVTRCKICSLLVVEVIHCKKSLVTRCKICSLLVAEVARSKKSLITRCKIRSLLVAEVARCKKSLVTRCKNSPVTRFKIRSLLVAEVESLFVTLWKRNSTTGAFLWIFAKL